MHLNFVALLRLASAGVCVLAWGMLPLNICRAAEKVLEPPQFNRDIRPLLSQNCFRCHGPDKSTREADMRFDTHEGIVDAFGGGLEDSEAWRRIVSDDPDELMPPPESHLSLKPAQRDVLRRWIEAGAPWQGHWAFIPPARPDVPVVKPAAESGVKIGDIDAFILQRLQRENIRPAPAANPRTLIRRVTLDLTGLPPTPDEVEAFVADPSPAAYKRVVERLLASPQYGERMALYWLDLVRYADSVGYHKDSHREVWLYRDYVIDAFNQNLPFDQFVKEQLAGDMLKGDKFQEYKWKVASGFNRLNQTTSEGGAQPKEYLAIYAADRVRNTSAIFLGTTLGCAECHDHKYDPFSARDFYSFAAFFADLKERGVGYPQQLHMPTSEQIAKMKQLENEIATLKEKLPNTSQGGDQHQAMTKQLAKLEAELKKASDAKTWPKTLVTETTKPRTMRVLPRGNWLDDSGEVVTPAVPGFLGSGKDSDERLTRLDLAAWIASRKNPLTARVFVNRLWKLMMGKGIARTLDDVGSQGEWPSHPQLLDWLAVEFMESGWDVKHMMKLIALSGTYRRSSTPTPEIAARDPENRLFARQNRYRLDAELVRDNALAISGLLSKKMGGRSVKPYQPANYWYKLYKDGKYVQDHGADLYRRGVYTYWRRSFWHPAMRAFDAPAREECVAERPRSNTPAQSLVLLNDPAYVEAARAFATRALKREASSEKERIERMFLRAVSRPPSQAEADILLGLLKQQRQRYAKDEAAAAALLSTGEAPLPADIAKPELAAWTALARAILNLHETITRS